MTKKQVINEDNMGKWVRTVWRDAGARDGVVVEMDDDYIGVFFPDSDTVEEVFPSQVIEIGYRALQHCFSGLTGMNELKDSLDDPIVR